MCWPLLLLILLHAILTAPAGAAAILPLVLLSPAPYLAALAVTSYPLTAHPKGGCLA